MSLGMALKPPHRQTQQQDVQGVKERHVREFRVARVFLALLTDAPCRNDGMVGFIRDCSLVAPAVLFGRWGPRRKPLASAPAESLLRLSPEQRERFRASWNACAKPSAEPSAEQMQRSDG